MMATGFSPSLRTSYSSSAVCQREWRPVSHLFGDTKWMPNQQKALDTMRVLVEQGSADPVVSTQFDSRVETAISMFDIDSRAPAIGVLEYLLNQVNVSEFNELANTLMWPQSHKTTLAAGTLISYLAKLACSAKDPRCMQQALVCLVNRLNNLCSYDRRTWEDFIQCPDGQDRFRKGLKSLVDTGVDLHTEYRGLQPLRMLLKPAKTISEQVDRRINELVQIWLQWLEECGIDLESYLRKEHDLQSDTSTSLSTFVRSYYKKTKNSGYIKVEIQVERHLLFDFAQTDLTKSLTVRHEVLNDSRHQKSPENESKDIPGTWVD